MKQSFQNTRYRAILLLTGLMLAMTTMAQTLTNDALDLSGMWRFQLDPMGFGKTPGSELYLDKLSETIMLPGSTDQGGKGIKNTARYVDRLSRKFEYQGAAWYQRERQRGRNERAPEHTEHVRIDSATYSGNPHTDHLRKQYT